MCRIPNSEKVKGLKSTPGNEDELEEEEDDSINDREGKYSMTTKFTWLLNLFLFYYLSKIIYKNLF